MENENTLPLLNEFKQFRKRHAFRARRNGFFGGNFLFRISELTQRERIYVHFANYRFSFRKLQISISQTTDFHFANYRFPFRFVPFRFANYSKPIARRLVPKKTKTIRRTQVRKFHFALICNVLPCELRLFWYSTRVLNRHLANKLLTCGQQSADSRPTVGRLPAEDFHRRR